jgi:hypothetical protein
MTSKVRIERSEPLNQSCWAIYCVSHCVCRLSSRMVLWLRQYPTMRLDNSQPRSLYLYFSAFSRENIPPRASLKSINLQIKCRLPSKSPRSGDVLGTPFITVYLLDCLCNGSLYFAWSQSCLVASVPNRDQCENNGRAGIMDAMPNLKLVATACGRGTVEESDPRVWSSECEHFRFQYHRFNQN